MLVFSGAIQRFSQPAKPIIGSILWTSCMPYFHGLEVRSRRVGIAGPLDDREFASVVDLLLELFEIGMESERIVDFQNF